MPDDQNEHHAELSRTLDELLAADARATLPDDLLQKMFTVAVKEYSKRYEENPELAPMLADHVNATDVTNSCLELLRVADLEVFELTFWGGRLSQDQG